MKKMRRSFILPAAALLAVSLSACAAANTSPSGQPASDASQTGMVEDEKDTAERTDETDTSVTEENTSKPLDSADRIQVAIQKNHEEFKADDGTILLTNDTEMPVVTIRGAEDIAAKINKDIEEYYAVFSSDDDEVLEWARSDYEERQGTDEETWFNPYTQDVTVSVTRMDDQVLTYKLTAGAYTGGAHGNYSSVAKNYDMTTGELIRFEDLAEDISRFHAAALDYMVNLAETPSYRERLFEPTKADLDSALFQTGSWVFTGSGIRFFSDPYALGPYSSGEIGFTLPYEKAYEIGLKDAYRYTGNFMEERYYTSQYDANTMENITIDGEPEYYFDLNGDGTEEGIAFYGFVYDAGSEDGKISLYIDGTDWGEVVRAQINPNGGYLEETYLLYNEDPSDDLTEIAVLFTEFYDDGSDSGITGRHYYTYLFQYTPEKELQFTKRLDGFLTNPLPPDTP